MPEVAEPRRVVEAVTQGISDERWAELDAWYADDAAVDYPFALPEPTRLEGREAIRRYFTLVAGLGLQLRAVNMVVHETADPEVVIAEWDYDGTITATGRTFRVSNIQVSRVQGGKIVASRDYHNHAILAEATGRLPALVAALSARTSR